MGDELKNNTIPISQIRENPVALRGVQTQSEKYQGLVDSIKAQGILNPISVRPQTDEETKETFFEIVDGLHRYSASKDAGLTVIPVHIIKLDDDQVLEAQIMANIHKVETKPAQYSKQLLRILSRNPLMTETELATKLSKTYQWIQARLGLNKITNEVIVKLVDDGEITLSNAYALAKLPPEEMPDFVDRAQTKAPDEFIPLVNKRVKEIKDAAKAGREAAPQVFEPVAYMQKMKAIKTELETAEIGPALCKEHIKTTTKDGATAAINAFALAIAWCMHLDPESQSVQIEADKVRCAERDEKKAIRQAASKKKAAAKAKVNAEKAEKEAEAAEKAAPTPTADEAAVAAE